MSRLKTESVALEAFCGAVKRGRQAWLWLSSGLDVQAGFEGYLDLGHLKPGTKVLITAVIWKSKHVPARPATGKKVRGKGRSVGRRT